MPDESMPVLYCAYHPDRETVLRCNRCDKPICYECAIRTPVGYRCKECVRGQQAVYYNAHPLDLPIAAAIGGVLAVIFGALAYALLGIFGLFSFLIALLVGPVVGGLIAEAVRRAVSRRRARHMNWVVIVAAILGILVGGFLLVGPLRIITRWDVLLFAVLMASTIYARLQ